MDTDNHPGVPIQDGTPLNFDVIAAPTLPTHEGFPINFDEMTGNILADQPRDAGTSTQQSTVPATPTTRPQTLGGSPPVSPINVVVFDVPLVQGAFSSAPASSENFAIAGQSSLRMLAVAAGIQDAELPTTSSPAAPVMEIQQQTTPLQPATPLDSAATNQTSTSAEAASPATPTTLLSALMGNHKHRQRHASAETASIRVPPPLLPKPTGQLHQFPPGFPPSPIHPPTPVRPAIDSAVSSHHIVAANITQHSAQPSTSTHVFREPPPPARFTTPAMTTQVKTSIFTPIAHRSVQTYNKHPQPRDLPPMTPHPTLTYREDPQVYVMWTPAGYPLPYIFPATNKHHLHHFQTTPPADSVISPVWPTSTTMEVKDPADPDVAAGASYWTVHFIEHQACPIIGCPKGPQFNFPPTRQPFSFKYSALLAHFQTTHCSAITWTVCRQCGYFSILRYDFVRHLHDVHKAEWDTTTVIANPPIPSHLAFVAYLSMPRTAYHPAGGILIDFHHYYSSVSPVSPVYPHWKSIRFDTRMPRGVSEPTPWWNSHTHTYLATHGRMAPPRRQSRKRRSASTTPPTSRGLNSNISRHACTRASLTC